MKLLSLIYRKSKKGALFCIEKISRSTRWILNKLFAQYNRLVALTFEGKLQFSITVLAFILLIVFPALKLLFDLFLAIKIADPIEKSISLAANITGLLTFVVTGIGFIKKRFVFQRLTENFKIQYLQMIQEFLPTFEKCGLELDNADFIKYSLRKLIPGHIDKHQRYENIDSLGYEFFSEFSLFISRYFGLNKAKSILVSLLVYKVKFELRSLYINSLKDQDFQSKESPYRKALALYRAYEENKFSGLMRLDIKSLDLSDAENDELYKTIVLPQNSREAKLFQQAESEALKANILQHVIGGSYAIIGFQDKTNKTIPGTSLIVKNEENFASWWKKVEEQVKNQLRAQKKPKLSDEEIEAYSLQKIIESKDSSLKKQPFSTALKKDPYISTFLDDNPWAPLYVIDADFLPIQFRGKPIEYIEKVVRRKAEERQKKLLKAIHSEFRGLKGIEKTLIFDYELIPFEIEKLIARTRPDRAPSFLDNHYLKSLITKENRADYVQAHLLQIRKVLSRISPLSLIIESATREQSLLIKENEVAFLRSLKTKDKKPIKFEGIDNILLQSGNAALIASTLFAVLKKKKGKITQVECKKIVGEIFSNARLISSYVEPAKSLKNG